MAATSVRGHFLWHELMTTDPKAAGAFYTKVIGWQPQKWEQDSSYTVLAYQGAPMAGVMRIPPDAKAMGAPPSWMPYVGADDIHVISWDAQRLGGKLLKGPEKTPTVGTWAVLQDPQGAVFGILSPEQTPKVGEEAGIGDFSWHELATANHTAAFDFYRTLFGWKKTDSFDMGPDGEYLIYGLGNQRFGGMYTKGKGHAGPPSWISYIRVADVKATAWAIQGARGTPVVGPMEVPGGDWITVATDPQGAIFAVHTKAASKTRDKGKKGGKSRKKTATKKKVTRRTAKAAKRPETKATRKKANSKKKAKTKAKRK